MISWFRKRVDESMRWRLRKFLPIVLTALVLQVLAPIAACWAVSIAASDPLHVGIICHDDAAAIANPTGQTGQPQAHNGCCSVCGVAQTAATIETPQLAVVRPYLQPSRVVWHAVDPGGDYARAGRLPQARGPPQRT